MTYYKVSTWDPKDTDRLECGWRCRVVRCRKWTLRRIIRRLLSQGYDRDVSIYVEAI